MSNTDKDAARIALRISSITIFPETVKSSHVVTSMPETRPKSDAALASVSLALSGREGYPKKTWVGSVTPRG